MATVLERPEGAAESVNIDAFLRELTSLSQRYRIGLTDGATLYAMEPEDLHRAYGANDESALSFN